MKPLRLSIGLLALSLSVGCTHSARLQGIKAPDQHVFFTDGKENLLSLKDCAVALSPQSGVIHSEARPLFLLAVINTSKQEVVVSPESITATLEAPAASFSTPIKIFTYEELALEEQRARTFGLLATGIQGTTESMTSSGAGYAESERRISQVQTLYRANMDLLSLNLKKQTVFPGNQYGGFFRIQLPALREPYSLLVFKVQVGQEIHELRFKLEMQ